MPQLVKDTPIFENKMILGQWHHAWAAKEQAIKSRLIQTCRQLEPRSRELLSLREGDQVLVQNQNKSNTRFNKWDQQGTVIALNDKDQYLIKIHGSGRVTLRNRRFLKKFKSLSGFNTKAWPRSMPVADNQSGVSKDVKPHQLVTECANPELHDGNDQLPGVNDAEMNSRLITEAADPGSYVEDQIPVDQLPVACDQNQEPSVATDRQPSITPDNSLQQSLSSVPRGRGRPLKKKRAVPWLVRRRECDVHDEERSQVRFGNPPEEETRRPIRERKQRLIYDPASGTSTTPSG